MSDLSSYNRDRHDHNDHRHGRCDDLQRRRGGDGRGYSIEKSERGIGAAAGGDSDHSRTRKDGDYHDRRGRSYSYDGHKSRSKSRARDGADYSYYSNDDNRDRSSKNSDDRAIRRSDITDSNKPSTSRYRDDHFMHGDGRCPKRYRDEYNSYKPREWHDQELGHGRRSQSHSVDYDVVDEDGKAESTQLKKEPREWPPSFDEEPSSFIFDTRSGMFWEGESQFFYDPKTKLYYSNRKALYYRYDSNEQPPFVEFQNAAPSEANQEVVDVINPTQLAGQTTAPSTTPGIKIAIKTKKLKRPNIYAENDNEPKKSPHEKKASMMTSSLSKEKQNIEKWSRQQQQRQKEEGNCNSPSSAEQESKPKIRTTAKGEPICLICKRKFPTIAKLVLHEKASQLHKKNLEKVQAEAKQKLETPKKLPAEAVANAADGSTMATATTSTYVDRAEKRRLMHHGTEASTIKEILSRSNIIDNGVVGTNGDSTPLSSGPTTHNNATPIGADLNSNNVGHKILQKMGWKSNADASACSTETSATTTTTTTSSSNNNNNDKSTTTDRLRADWDKIERIAHLNSRK